MALFGNRKHRTEVLERPEYGWIWKPLLALLVIYLVVCLALGIWWSQRPEPFDIEQATTQRLAAPADASLPRGARLTASLVTVVETLLDKPGGWLRNDMLLPGVWLDNMPSWEYGVLTQARTLGKALPAMSDTGTQALESANKGLQSNSKDWLYPAAEKRYSQAQGAFDGYLAGIAVGDEGFAANGDGLASWLNAVSRRFSGLTQRLLASVDDPEALRELGVEESALPDSTPWFHIDNVFFEARGDAWGLMQLLKAARLDYADVLGKANGDATLERLIAELELAQRRVWSPVILNGSGFGIFANHSLVLANHTQAVAELAGQLAGSVQGVEVTAADSGSPATDGDSGSASAMPTPTDNTVDNQTDPAPAGDTDGANNAAPAEEGAANGGGDTQSDSGQADTAANVAGGSEPASGQGDGSGGGNDEASVSGGAGSGSAEPAESQP